MFPQARAQSGAGDDRGGALYQFHQRDGRKNVLHDPMWIFRQYEEFNRISNPPVQTETHFYLDNLLLNDLNSLKNRPETFYRHSAKPIPIHEGQMMQVKLEFVSSGKKTGWQWGKVIEIYEDRNGSNNCYKVQLNGRGNTFREIPRNWMRHPITKMEKKIYDRLRDYCWYAYSAKIESTRLSSETGEQITPEQYLQMVEVLNVKLLDKKIEIINLEHIGDHHVFFEDRYNDYIHVWPSQQDKGSSHERDVIVGYSNVGGRNYIEEMRKYGAFDANSGTHWSHIIRRQNDSWKDDVIERGPRLFWEIYTSELKERKKEYKENARDHDKNVIRHFVKCDDD